MNRQVYSAGRSNLECPARECQEAGETLSAAFSAIQYTFERDPKPYLSSVYFRQSDGCRPDLPRGVLLWRAAFAAAAAAMQCNSLHCIGTDGPRCSRTRVLNSDAPLEHGTCSRPELFRNPKAPSSENSGQKKSESEQVPNRVNGRLL